MLATTQYQSGLVGQYAGVQIAGVKSMPVVHEWQRRVICSYQPELCRQCNLLQTKRGHAQDV
jgi:hypothetical protein